MCPTMLMSRCPRRLTALLLAWIGVGMAAESPAHLNAAESRTLRFPPGMSLGSLSLEDPSLGSRCLERGHDLSLPLGLSPEHVAMMGDWDFLARAIGEVEVPTESNVMLRVFLEPRREDFQRMSRLDRMWYQKQFHRGSNELSGFSTLDAEDLYRLDVSALVRRSDADRRVLGPISHLTGLKILCLSQTGVTCEPATGLASLTSLRALQLQREFSIGNEGLSVLKDLPNLEYLDLDTGARDAGLKYLRDHPNLRWLRLRMGRFHGPGLANLATLPRLERLSLWGERGLTDRHLRYLEGCTQLKALTLWGDSYRFTDEALASIGKLAVLEELIFIYASSRFTEAGIIHLKDLPQLRKLKFFNTELNAASIRVLIELEQLDTLTGITTTEEGVAALATKPSIRHLGVHFPQGRGRTTDPASFAPLGSLGDLEELRTGGSDRELALLEGLTHLKDLQFRSNGVTDRGLASIGRMRSLEHLRLPCLGTSVAPTRLGLNRLGALSELQSLDVSSYPRDDSARPDPHVPLDLGSLTKLNTLSLSGFHLQAHDLQWLRQLPHLEWLVIQTDAIDETVFEHINGLPQLKHLFITNVRFNTGTGLSRLAGLPKLETIRLHGDMDDAALLHLGGLPSLRSLHIETPAAIQADTVAYLRDTLPALHGVTINQVGGEASEGRFQSPRRVRPATR